MNNLGEKTYVAMDILRLGIDNVSTELYKAAEKTVLEYLIQKK